jgi:RNA polymerase sigma-70 factor, ECF subfamily
MADPGTFGSLLEPLIPNLRRYARSLTHDRDWADDLVQDTLAQAVAKQDRWEPGTNLVAWLMTIMRNKWLDDTKRIRRHGEVEMETAPALQAAERADITAVLASLRVAFAKVPPDFQRILLLAAQGYSKKEMAAIEAIPIGTVGSRTNRGRQMLRALWE